MDKSKKVVHGVVALILDENQNILAAKRRDDQVYGGHWEFPGGKIEPGEDSEQTLIRELKEELNIVVTDYIFLDNLVYEYPEFTVNLKTFQVTGYNGQVCGFEGQEIKWIKIQDVAKQEKILPASMEMLKLLSF